MRYRWKKVLCILLCASMCVGITMMKAEATESKKVWTFTQEADSQGISPRWAQVLQIVFTLDFKNGNAIATASAMPRYGGVETVVYAELLNDYKVSIASATSSSWSTLGTETDIIYPVESGRVYYVRATVTIKDSQGAVLECVTKTSEGYIAK